MRLPIRLWFPCRSSRGSVVINFGPDVTEKSPGRSQSMANKGKIMAGPIPKSFHSCWSWDGWWFWVYPIVKGSLNVGRQHLVANLEVFAGQRPEPLHPVPSGGSQPLQLPAISWHLTEMKCLISPEVCKRAWLLLFLLYIIYDSLPLSAPIISKGKIAVWRIPWVSLLVTGGVGQRAVQVPKTMDGYELLHNGSLDHWTRAALGPLWFLGLCFGSSELLVFRGCFQSSLIGA